MRVSFISIISILAITARCSNLDDGFNLYKNYVRALPADTMELDNGNDDPVLYFYRTPLKLYPGLFTKRLFQPLKYRNTDSGTFRSRMMNKELEPGLLRKRTSKAALSLMMQTKPSAHTEGEHYCPYGK